MLSKLMISLRKRRAELFSPRLAVYDRLGAKLVLDKRNMMDIAIIGRKPYEVAQMRRLTGLVERYGARTFIDAGANLGLYTIAIGKLAGIERVYAFEPVPRIYNQLGANIFLNHLDGKCVAINVALSDKAGVETLHVNRRYSGRGSLVYGMNQYADEALSVRTEAFDRLPNIELSEPVAAKIDVEGHELAVLVGMSRTLTRHRMVVQIESTVERRAAIEEALERHGLVKVDQIDTDGYFVSKDLADRPGD